MTTESRRTRRDHSPELKARILAECQRPGASVAKVALSHGINANLVHCWRRLERQCRQGAVAQVDTVTPIRSTPIIESIPFVPVAVTPATNESTIDIELHRGALTMKASWPLSAAAQCAAWAREVLR